MKDIKQIIADNLIELRKQHNLTQNDLAKKLQYSDNTISRWEHAEITPSIEILQKIGEVFDVPLENLLKENMAERVDETNKKTFVNKIASMLFSLSAVWLIAIILFVYAQTFLKVIYWMAFVWAIPVSCLVLLIYQRNWGNKVFGFVVGSVLIWSFISSIYLQFLEYNVYLIFLVGVPIQAALSVLTFVKKKEKGSIDEK